MNGNIGKVQENEFWLLIPNKSPLDPVLLMLIMIHYNNSLLREGMGTLLCVDSSFPFYSYNRAHQINNIYIT